MKYLIKSLPEIEKKMRSYPGCMLMLDFDGTLSALAKTPAQAFLAEKNKMVLQLISRLAPVAIVTGRSLKDIKHKVGLKKNIYAGNHGLEWQIGKRKNRVSEPSGAKKLLNAAKRSFKKIEKNYPGVLLEDKHLSLAIHFRNLDPILVPGLKRDINTIIKMINIFGTPQILLSKKVIELRPKSNWNKGKFALFIQEYLQNKLGIKFTPIYLGDDTTDEDVFSALRQKITIRVGQSKISQAKYYLKNVRQVEKFLDWLLKK